MLQDETSLENKIFGLTSSEAFEAAALEVFRFQYKHVSIYRTYCEHLKISEESVNHFTKIPFLPIQFFKSHRICTSGYSSEVIFTSSGTTGSIPSKHHLAKKAIYERSFRDGFNQLYGNPESYAIIALLPSYLERKDASLVYMIEAIIQDSNHKASGFYLHDTADVISTLEKLDEAGQKTMVIGVSYALLDLIEKQRFNLKHTIIMETGGMKGRRKEMVKEELHEHLIRGFGVSKIHSEYGMTELLSQAYSKGDGRFTSPPWMRILTRDPEDALRLVDGKTGGINVIDLANLYSCAFIATQDLGKTHADGSFEILGRFDMSDIRGCNLMVL